MGRRSRKRGTSSRVRPQDEGSHAVGPPAQAPRTLRRRARLDEMPPAPWAPVPLVELCILLGIILVVVGFLVDGARELLASGLALITLSTLDQTLREHMAGFRSHTLLLAGVVAVVVALPLFLFSGLPQVAILVVAALVFAAAAWGMRDVFRRRTGGLGFRA